MAQPPLKSYQIKTGTTINDLVVLEDTGGGTPGLPAVDGSQLTGLGGVSDTLSTFTPTFPGLTVANVQGQYYQVGRMVMISAYMEVTTVDNTATTLQIQGLPVTTSSTISTNSANGGSIITSPNVIPGDFAGGYLWQFGASATVATLYYWATDGSASSITNNVLQVGSTLSINFTYFTD